MELLHPGTAELALRSYAAMCPQLAEVDAGYFSRLLSASGAQEVDVRVRELSEAGARWKAAWV